MTQKLIDQMQANYKEWLALQEKLSQAHQDLQRSVELMKSLQAFYFDGEWRKLYEKIENGEQFDLTTDGEYSVMSEDTIWNAVHEQESLLWQQLRFAVKHLDKDAHLDDED
ncbi:DUF4298 domain-containing protein [Moraxella sp.]|uniref:DUF4298 domain-containing protein n=1 Tax=Moraxella sp. TaxID=479 RepID=UPI0026DD8053|nr:DUF4298 domain-containing protein [Moraxella sp.]MDO4895206.1 DUF4298 domain-containing protein [Moraxella sp.]